MYYNGFPVVVRVVVNTPFILFVFCFVLRNAIYLDFLIWKEGELENLSFK